ncbi:MAG: hypothetical protein R2780_14855 [Crocinitomicaceae bacterium]|nr:hypothetical protein [Crocinitomicaceae bacterium]
MKRLTIIFLLSSCAAFAQEDNSFSGGNTEDTSEFKYNAFKERVYFWQMEKNWKFSPLEVFNAVPSLGIDLETVMKPGLSFQYGAAFIPSFLQFAVGSQDDQFNWMNGYKVRFESRWSGFRRPNMYVSGEISLRHLVINDETSFGMEGDGWGNYAYFINQDMLYHRFSTQFNFKWGMQKYFDNSFVVDMFVGMSLRRNNVISGSDAPLGGEPQIWWNRFEWRLEDGYSFGYMMPIVGLKFGWHQNARRNL